MEQYYNTEQYIIMISAAFLQNDQSLKQYF